MKLKLKFKKNVNIIFLIGFFILGALWLYKKNIVEGYDGDEEEEEEEKDRTNTDDIDTDKASELAEGLPDQFSSVGIQLPTSFDDVLRLITSLKTGITTELAATNAAKAAREAEEANTPVGNMLAPILSPNSFFTGNKFGDAFCKINSGNPTNLSNQCATLTSDNCNATDCCVWVNGSKCMAGDASGPTTPSGTTGNVDAEYYSYKYKCYGQCDSPIIAPITKTIASKSIVDNQRFTISADGVLAESNVIGDCSTDERSTTVTAACVNEAWSIMGCKNTWKQLPTNKGWYQIPDSILGVDTTDKNLYLKENSTQVADITGQSMKIVANNMANLARINPSACSS